MFPYIASDHHDFPAYAKFRTARGKYDEKTNKQILIEGGAENVYNKYRDYYEGDPLIGSPAAVLEAPPIDNLYAIYGINLRTENLYFFKPNTARAGKKITEYSLDSDVCSPPPSFPPPFPFIYFYLIPRCLSTSPQPSPQPPST